MTVIDFNKARRQGEPTPGHVDAEDIRKRLHDDPTAFVQWLYSGRAFINKNEARIGDVYGEPGASLSIQLSGADAGLWKDHATDEGGDLIALYRACMGYNGNTDFVLSLKEIAKDFFGDPVEVPVSPWTPSAQDRINKQKEKLGTKPREDMLELGAPVATWKYYDTRGNVIASVVRYHPDGNPENKTFRPYCFRKIDGTTKWVMGAPDLRPLYRLPEISLASTVVLVEGEGCAQALADIGIEATTAMQGAKAPIDKTDWSPLVGKTVIIWPDNDEPGFQYGKSVVERLQFLGCRVLGVEPPPDKPKGWDVKDCIKEGGDAASMIASAKLIGDDASAEGEPLPRLLTAAQFVAGFTPPEYLVDGIMQRGYLYSLTARTGHGKTAVAMYIAQAIARGMPMHGKAVKAGTVLLLAGENPDDIRARFLVLADEFKFVARDIKMRFVAGVVNIEASMPVIRAEAESIPDLVLVIVDTAAAYFNGDDTNSNSQQGAYARLLRQLSYLPGKPAVLVNCHPVKNAAKDNLLPMGGSAFLNEVDGNLTLWANSEKQTTLHWQGKFRGPEFEPLTFEMKTVTSNRVHDANGELMPSVVAEPVSDHRLEMSENKQARDEITLLGIIAKNKNASVKDLAIKCGFINEAGQAQKSKTFRICERLIEDKLVERVRGKFRITAKGKKEIEHGNDKE